jgi:hypothetical protein
MMIDDFEEYFHDVRKCRPQEGEVLAKFTAMADLVDDWPKRNMIALLVGKKCGSESVKKVMRNMIGAVEIDSIRVPLQMAIDLANGFTKEDVYAKPYHFQMEQYWWAKREHVPTDDPHWTVIPMVSCVKGN